VEYLLLFFSAVLGLIFGSFLNVLIYRLNEEGVPKFWQGRSFCPRCKHTLSWEDNIPLFSFLFLGGKCRHCHKKISIQYPIVELVSTSSTVALFVSLPHSNVTELLIVLCYWIIFLSLIVIFFSDLKYSLIPDEMVVTFILGSLGALLLTTPLSNVGFNLIVGLLSSLALLLIVIATLGRGMGLGDVKFAVPMGIFLGFPRILVAFWMAFVGGGIVALLLMILRRKGMKDAIPLGPFLVLGTVLAFLYSDFFWQILGVR